MKKIGLMALVAAVGVVSAGSANAMTNTQNPLYMPGEGKAYVQTDFYNGDSDNYDSRMGAMAEFGFGVMKNMSIFIGAGYEEIELNSGTELSDMTKPYIGTQYRFMDKDFILDGQLAYAMADDDSEVTDDRDELVFGLRLGQHVTKDTSWAVTLDGIHNFEGDVIDASTDAILAFNIQSYMSKEFSLNGRLAYAFMTEETMPGDDDVFVIGAQGNYHFNDHALAALYVDFNSYTEDLEDEFIYGLKVDFQF